MIVLGIDPGVTLGWAVLRRTRARSVRVASGSVKFKSKTGARFDDLCVHVRELIEAYAPDIVVVEKPARLKSYGALRSVIGTIVVVEMAAALHELPFALVTAMDVKKTATKRSRAEKIEMQNAAKKRWRMRTLPTPDEADALWIAQTFHETEP